MADETNNRNAVFKFYLNRQGVKGNKGEKGEQGFSPVIEVSENTASSYKLQITTETDQFETPNLRGDEIDTSQGGSYVRYNEETQQMYVGAADSASSTQAGMIKIASDEDIANLSENAALTPDNLVNNAGSILQSSDSSISITQDPDTLKIDLKANVVEDISRLEARMSADEILLGSHQISIDNLDRDKVDKVTGKGLSTNDFTNEAKDKLTHAVIDTDLANVAFTGNFNDLINQPTIPVIPANNLTGDSVDGTTIVYDNITGKISATAQTYTLPTASTTTLGGVKIDGTSITIDNNGIISSSGGSTPSNMVTTDTSQTITGNKTFQNSNLILGTSTYSKFNLANTYGDALRPETTTSTGLMHFAYNINQNVATISSNRTRIDGSTRGLLRILPTTVYNHPETEGYIMTHNLVDMSYKPYLTVGKITSTGGTVTITDNGINGINIEAAGGSTPTNMVTTDTEQTISGHKIFSDTSTEIAGDLYITKDGTSYIRMGDNTAYATPILIMDDTNDILTVGDTSKFLKLKAYNNVVVSNQRGNEFTIGYDTLTYKKSDDTVVDLLALEARIAALEARINGGNA